MQNATAGTHTEAPWVFSCTTWGLLLKTWISKSRVFWPKILGEIEICRYKKVHKVSVKTGVRARSALELQVKGCAWSAVLARSLCPRGAALQNRALRNLAPWVVRRGWCAVGGAPWVVSLRVCVCVCVCVWWGASLGGGGSARIPH